MFSKTFWSVSFSTAFTRDKIDTLEIAISFIPQRCKGHICDVALEDEIKGISGSHIFVETMDSYALREEIYSAGRKVLYRRDSIELEGGIVKWKKN